MCDSIGSVGEVCAFYQAGTKGGKGQLRCAHAFGGERDCGVNLLPSWAAVAHKTELSNESYPFS